MDEQSNESKKKVMNVGNRGIGTKVSRKWKNWYQNVKR